MNQIRTHNAVNEIINISESGGESWIDPACAALGNRMTILKPSRLDLAALPLSEYDTRHRLTEVKQGEAMVARYEHDGRQPMSALKLQEKLAKHSGLLLAAWTVLCLIAGIRGFDPWEGKVLGVIVLWTTVMWVAGILLFWTEGILRFLVGVPVMAIALLLFHMTVNASGGETRFFVVQNDTSHSITCCFHVVGSRGYLRTRVEANSSLEIPATSKIGWGNRADRTLIAYRIDGVLFGTTGLLRLEDTPYEVAGRLIVTSPSAGSVAQSQPSSVQTVVVK